ncbi:hypothetical protein FMM80_18470 [Schaedlerella arabinosiphila]|uniref:Uncharacterized protein n=1 Tax=Schaedlerella arabinosiphila TaxID=2044587 RepID=A0A9X5CA39_9FIRM|nr:hypothetical protein [Schaedlerella arabinosiphila]KAI4443587.1 hypothetical protein C824_006123 [Schaedlerella arabinosiphila]NDO70520.1 hypothetical protein [Schaedlerella arabinosiphila]
MKEVNFCKNKKIRLTEEQDQSINTVAKEKNIPFSDVMRHAMFDKGASSPYAIAIQHNMIKNELMNRIQVLDISKSAREKIMKELSTVGEYNF